VSYETAQPAPPASDPDATRRSETPFVPPAAAALTGWPTPTGYEILGELGRGGMGVVYKAFDRKRNQTVALKTMQALDAAALFRFKQEFRTLADVSHPNLVTLYELIHDGVQWFFTMEFVEGTDFLTHVRAAPGRLRPALRQLAEGVAALHGEGILHRDLKPHNVLVTTEGRVVLLDFGLAAELDREGIHASTTQHVLGTVAYMSPEQADGQPLTPASDWYSVGVILYETLTGRLPFMGGLLQVLRDKGLREPPPPRELAAGAPHDLDALCADLLRRQPERRPDAAEVLRRLGSPAAATAPAPLRSSPPAANAGLVGREKHLQALADAFAAVRQGRTMAVHVAGRSGAGKSALVQRFLDGLGGKEEVVVLTGQCYEQESVPFKAFDNLIDGLTRYLGRLSDADLQAVLPRDLFSLCRVFPVLKRLEKTRSAQRVADIPDLQEVRRRAFAALRELLARLGDRKPLVLCVDDLQWGDADSAALLAELLRPPDAPVFLFLGCYRDEEPEASPFLAAWARAREGMGGLVAQRELIVEALSEAGSRELALRLFGRADEASRVCAEAVARESGGNPFFVSELVRHVQAGPLVGDGSVLQGDVSLDQVVWRRVQRLPEGARNLLAVVAVAARPLRQEEVLQAADLGNESLSALAALRASHLLRNVGSAGAELLATYHDRVRESVVSHLPPEAVRRTHHRLAVVLEATGRADPELLAAHFLGAEKSAAAGIYYAAAAERAAQALAFDRAAQLYRQAIRLCPPEGQDLRALRLHLADALANAGRGSEAAEAYQTLTSEAAPAEALELRRRAAFQWLISGHSDEGLATMRTVLQAVGIKMPGPGRRALGSLLWRQLKLRLRGLRFRVREASQVPPELLTQIDACWAACMGLSMVDPIRAAAIQAENLLLALRAGEPNRLARAMLMECGHRATTGDVKNQRTSTFLEMARALVRQGSEPLAHGRIAFVEGLQDYFSGRWRGALVSFDRAIDIFRDRCAGAVWELDTAKVLSLFSLYYLGEMTELKRRSLVLSAESKERGNNYLFAMSNTGVGLFWHLLEDDPEEVRSGLDQALDRWPNRGSYSLAPFSSLISEALINLYQGQPLCSLERVMSAWPSVTTSLLLRVQNLRVMILHVRAGCALAAAVINADYIKLLRNVESDVKRLERERAPWSIGFARLLGAGYWAVQNQGRKAEELLADAILRFEAVEMPLYAAAARRRLGQLRGGDEGQALIEQADAWMQRQEIQRPDRWTAMLAPGFPNP
jgi:tetratricopeptide (TPR) repeat protein